MSLFEPQSTRKQVPIGALALSVQACVLAGCFLALFLCAGLGWMQESTLRSVVFAGAAVACGAFAGLVVVAWLLRQSADFIAPGIVAAGVVRSLVSLTLGLGVYFVVAAEGRAFWAAFLSANLLCLVAESAWGIWVNHRLHGRPAMQDCGVRA